MHTTRLTTLISFASSCWPLPLPPACGCWRTGLGSFQAQPPISFDDLLSNLSMSLQKREGRGEHLKECENVEKKSVHLRQGVVRTYLDFTFTLALAVWESLQIQGHSSPSH